MAEVIGVISSVIAILQITGSLISVGYEYIASVKDAQSDIQQLISELLSLSNVLLTLQDNIRSMSNKPQKLAALQTLNKQNGPLPGCTKELEELRAKLELNRKSGLEGRIKRLIWPLKEKETLGHLKRLERHRALFSLALAADQLTLLKEIDEYIEDISLTVHELKEESSAQGIWMQKKDVDYAAKKRQTVLNWIFDGEFDTRHLQISDQRQKGTGEWLLKSPELQKWIEGHPDFLMLWGHGIPGSGKTFLSSSVIDYLLLQAPAEGYGVGYVYFDYIEKDMQRPIRVVASLLKQLASQILPLPTEVEKVHDKIREQVRKPKLEELYNLLITTSKKFSRVFFIFDALDECDEREELLLIFHRLSESGISIFLTSRPHPYDIQESLCDRASIELFAKEEDISTYIQQRMEKNTRAKGLVGKYRDQVISDLVDCAQGMFLLVRFHVEHICGQTTVRQVLKELERLKTTATNSKRRPLDPTYDKVMDGILKQTEDSTDLALATLSWLVKAKRALTIDEIQQALSIEPDPSEYELDELNIPDATTLLDVCGGLVVIDEKTKTVRLAHYTVHEYLLRKELFPDAESKIATACITYLTFDEFSKGLCKSWDQDPLLTWDGRFEAYPFLRYAAKYLSDHLRACDFASTTTALLRFLENQGNIDSYMQASSSDSFSYYTRPGDPSLCIASTIGHYPVVQHLLRNGVDCSTSDSSGVTALQRAASEGHDQIVQLLLQEGADFLTADHSEWTSLSKAAVAGHKTTIQLLLDHGADFSTTQNNQHWQNALNLAAFRGHTEIVQLLLEKGPDPTTRDQGIYGWASLYYASMKGHKETVQVLLDHGDGKDISALNKNGETALHQAANQGHIEIVKLLLQNGADVSIIDEKRLGETAIHRAAFEGHEQVVRLLLEHGADISALDKDGSTALHKAVAGGHIQIVRLFLEKDINTALVKDNKKRTALKMALLTGHKDIAQLLLESGGLEDIATQDDKGETELHRAAYSGYKDVVSFLLDKGADTSIKDNKGWTALHKAVSRGYFDVVQLLLKNGADLSATTNSGSTALVLAAEGPKYTVSVNRDNGIGMGVYTSMCFHKALENITNGQHEVFRLLIEGEDTVPPAPYNSSRFIRIPGAGRYKDVCQLLIDYGADLSTLNESGQTLLHLAAYSGRVEVIQLLLETGADILAKDNDGRTPLHKAAMVKTEFRSLEAIRLLLKNGADISALDNSGQTALHLMASHCWGAGSLVLLEKGIDISVQDNSGQTALHLAAYGGAEGCVELLLEWGADVSVLNGAGQTALHLGAHRCWLVPRVLLLNGADVSIRDNSGRTALHWAAKSSETYTIGHLLDNGADILAQDNSGQTALHLAVYGYHEAMELLLKRGIDISTQDNSGKTVLHIAAFNGSIHYVKSLLEKGADPSIRDKSGQTALHLAASRGLCGVVQLLLENEIEISIKDNSGLTALHVAAAAYEAHEEDTKLTHYSSEPSRLPETIQLLLDNGADPLIISNYEKAAMYKTRIGLEFKDSVWNWPRHGDPIG